MVDVRQALPNHVATGSAPLSKILNGYVSANQPAPTSFAQPIFVIVPNHSTENAYGPLSWSASHGATLPVQGSPVVLGIDDNGTPHVLSWDGPYAAPPLVGIARGTGTLTFTASNLSANLTVSHGLGGTPAVVVATAFGAPAVNDVAMPNTFGYTATQFGVNGNTISAFTGTCNIAWIAVL